MIWLPAAAIGSTTQWGEERAHHCGLLFPKEGGDFVISFVHLFRARISLLGCRTQSRVEQSLKSNLNVLCLNWLCRMNNAQGDVPSRFLHPCPGRHSSWKVRIILPRPASAPGMHRFSSRGWLLPCRVNAMQNSQMAYENEANIQGAVSRGQARQGKHICKNQG